MTAISLPSLAGNARDLWRRGSASAWLRPPMIFGYVVLAFWIVAAIGVQWIAPYDPIKQVGERLLTPSGAHWFGTDALGRDVFSRTLYGARYSLPIAAVAIVVSVTIGSVLGAVAGYFGGWVDAVIMRIADMTMAFPAILLAMAVAASLGPGLNNALIAIVIVWWPIYARLMRGQVLSIKQREHVESAVAIGASGPRILFRHIVPQSLTPILVNATMDLGQVILLVASLSFLGLGALPPTPEWGAMITDGAKNFYQPWIAAAPGFAMLTIVLAINFIGDGLRDALDVKATRR
ncbi:ABC transporter permease [Cryobacterium algoricola]|uniref:ABC transporter permease n=2 Tax=Cryobacterium TaxID=69578 RepID=A0AA41QZ60_9MICO|nr:MULTISPECIES: ABC transporter permease [Cryobacterium]MCI4659524.1 ABC transporter permease [Cryobacterium zhongshanensis]TFB84160.1 ABC transporter permease [Cryobacterium algoricola]